VSRRYSMISALMSIVRVTIPTGNAERSRPSRTPALSVGAHATIVGAAKRQTVAGLSPFVAHGFLLLSGTLFRISGPSFRLFFLTRLGGFGHGDNVDAGRTRRRGHARKEKTLQYPTCGRTRIKVAPYCLGAMMFGAAGNLDPDDGVRFIHRALDAGIHFIATARL
jgi:hypothetical protein